jgi:inosine-uridine nucleoside N-ribohydrolase
VHALDPSILPAEGTEGKKGVIAMAEGILASKTPVALVATGALTNVALCLQLFPEVKENIRQISFMGGAMETGNRSPVAEFNILCDPEAAEIVVNSGCEVVMVPLEVTHTALATEPVLERILRMNSPYASMVVDLLCFFKQTYLDVFNFASPPLHDPCAVAYIINPDMFVARKMRVDIERSSSFCDGQTVCDVWGDSNATPNVTVTTKMDFDGFWDMMCEALEKGNEASAEGKTLKE